MSRGSIVVCRPRTARRSTVLASARAVGRSLVRNVMAYGAALNARREQYRMSREAAEAAAQAEADMMVQWITSIATSYEPVSAYDYFQVDARARYVQASARRAVESGYVGFISGVHEHEPATRLRRSEPNLAEVWGD